MQNNKNIDYGVLVEFNKQAVKRQVKVYDSEIVVYAQYVTLEHDTIMSVVTVDTKTNRPYLYRSNNYDKFKLID